MDGPFPSEKLHQIFFHFLVTKHTLIQHYHVISIDVILMVVENLRQLTQKHRIIIFGLVRCKLDLAHEGVRIGK